MKTVAEGNRNGTEKAGRIEVGESFVGVKIVERLIVLEGLTDIMFDRYPGDNRTQLEPYQKLYLKEGTKEICLPSLNIVSALTAENTNSFPRVIIEKRKYKDFARAVLSYISISPDMIPFLRDGKKIYLGSDLSGDIDKESGIYIHRVVARLAKGIPNPKVRPVLPCPWNLEFKMKIFPNREFKEQELRNVFSQGLMALGLGTFRGVFGKARIVKWE